MSPPARPLDQLLQASGNAQLTFSGSLYLACMPSVLSMHLSSAAVSNLTVDCLPQVCL